MEFIELIKILLLRQRKDVTESIHILRIWGSEKWSIVVQVLTQFLFV